MRDSDLWILDDFSALSSQHVSLQALVSSPSSLATSYRKSRCSRASAQVGGLVNAGAAKREGGSPLAGEFKIPGAHFFDAPSSINRPHSSQKQSASPMWRGSG